MKLTAPKLGTTIVLVNLLLMFLYIIPININSHDHGEWLSETINSFLLSVAHIGICVIAGFSNHEPERKHIKQAFLLSAVLIPLVGFSACTGLEDFLN